MTARCAFYDPGGEVDYFAMMTADITRTKILLTDAKGWIKKDMPDEPDFYGFIERKIASYHSRFKFDYHVCEKNNIGTTVIGSLRNRYRIPVIGITTSNNITNEKILREGKSYNKDSTLAWINRFRAAGVIEFPRTMTPGLKLMKEHLDNFGSKKKGGRVVYEALHGHDDFVTCLNLCVHYAKKNFLNLPEIRTMIQFDGAASDFYPKDTNSRLENGKLFAKNLLEKKGILFDKIDIRFPS
jgi:hypothetical protein